MTARSVALRYAAFALVATMANLAMQRLVLSFGSGSRYFLTAMVMGTLVGLVIKYVLDKRWIFDDRSKGFKDNGLKFSLYSATGVLTTGLFWGSETLFWLVGQTHVWREAGAVIGLGAGYVLKYRLDRRFVFAAPVSGAGS